MFADSQDLFIRYGASRAGRHLVAISKAALPVTVVNTSVIAQEKKGIPLLDEFILRAISLGQGQTHQIAKLSGVAESLINSSAAGLAATGNLIYGVREGVLALTPMGAKTAIELATVKPVQRQFKVCFDRTLWCVMEYDPNDLMSKSEAREDGQLILPAFKSSRIGDPDITVANLNGLIRKGNIGSSELDILRITKLSGNTHRYLSVLVLVYVDAVNMDIELALIVDDELSHAHELPLISLGVADRLEIVVAKDSVRPILSDELEVAREAQASSPQPSHATSSLSQVAPVVGFEHRVLLEKALVTTDRRLVIATENFDADFVINYIVPKIGDLLKKGVVVKIALGYSQNDEGADQEVLGPLTKLSSRYPAALSIVWNQHHGAGSLIFDDTWIETSFGWLEEISQPPKPLALHEGTLVRGHEYADAKFEFLNAKLFRNASVDAPIPEMDSHLDHS